MDIDAALASAHDLAVLPNRQPALLLLERIVAEDPGHGRALALYAHCLRLEGRHHESYFAARSAVEANPDDPDCLAELGWSKFLNDEDDAALELAKQAIAADPDHPAGWCLLGYWGLHHDRFRQAEEAALVLLRSSPDDEEALIMLGRAKVGQGQVDEANEAFHLVLASHPDSADARNGLAAAAMLRNEPARAVALVREAAKLNPESFDADIEFRASYGVMAEIMSALLVGRSQAFSGRATACLLFGFLAVIGSGIAAVRMSGSFFSLPTLTWAVSAPLTFMALAVAAERSLDWTVRLRSLLCIVALHGALWVALAGDAPAIGLHRNRDASYSPFWATVALLFFEAALYLRATADLDDVSSRLEAVVRSSAGAAPRSRAMELTASGFERLRDGRQAEAYTIMSRATDEDSEWEAASEGLEIVQGPIWSAYQVGGPAAGAWELAPGWVQRIRWAMPLALAPAFVICVTEAALTGSGLAVLRYAGLVSGILFLAAGFDRLRTPMARSVTGLIGLAIIVRLSFGSVAELYGVKPPAAVAWLSPYYLFLVGFCVTAKVLDVAARRWSGEASAGSTDSPR